MFDFHPFFDGLLGYESLKKLDASIITANNTLKIGQTIIPLHTKNCENEITNLEKFEYKITPVQTPYETGDFYLEKELELFSNVFILPGVYSSRNHVANVAIFNCNASKMAIEIPKLMDFEINNFEIPSESTFISNLSKNNLDNFLDNIKNDHLNSEEIKKLEKLLSDYKDIFVWRVIN